MLFVVAAVGGGGFVPDDATWEYHTANHKHGSALSFGPGKMIRAKIFSVFLLENSEKKEVDAYNTYINPITCNVKTLLR